MANLQITTKSFFKIILGLTLIFVLSKTCYTEAQVLVNPEFQIQAIPAAKNHYQSLKQKSTQPMEGGAAEDKIRFPEKKYWLLTKVLSPAYLTRNQIQELMLTIKPPANSSEQTKAELDFLLNLQNTRTAAQEELALKWNEIIYLPIPGMNDKNHLFFEGQIIMGEDCIAENYPATEKLLNNIMKEMRIMEFTAKNHFLRARPRQLSKELKPLVKMNTSSFASGHTLWAYLQAYIWGELIPQKRTEFIDLAYEIGFTREILGVHYPSDEEASRNLAHRMLELMWKTEKFQKHFKKAKAEWK